MAITTDNGKLAVMGFATWLVPLPMGTVIDQATEQQLLWGFPEVLWSVGETVVALFCALTGMSAMTGGGDLHELGG